MYMEDLHRRGHRETDVIRPDCHGRLSVAATVACALDRLGVTYPNVLDPNYQSLRAFRIECWPSMYIADRERRIRRNRSARACARSPGGIGRARVVNGSAAGSEAYGNAAQANTEATALPPEFEPLTMPHFTAVSRFARSLTRDRTQADDLVQETYLLALRGWHTFRPAADAQRWLFSICHHAFLRIHKRDALYVEPPEGDPELESLATALAHLDAERSGAAITVERLDLRSAIDRALATLAPAYRVVVVLVDVEGQTYGEAAAVLDVPVGTVRSRLFRGRRLLQDLLFEHASDAGFTSADDRQRESRRGTR
jgi:RNA polymerase sigma-70 factor (ECF subfamily)